MTPDPYAYLDAARRELLQSSYEERAAILEYDAGLPRAEAERIARAMTERRFQVECEITGIETDGKAKR